MTSTFIFIASSIREAVEAQKHMVALGMTVEAETWGGTWERVRNGRGTELVFGHVRVAIPDVARSSKLSAVVDGKSVAIRPWSMSGDKHEIKLTGSKS